MRRSRNFCQGVGGGGSLTARKQPEQRFFVCFLLVLNLFYSLQRGSNGFITEIQRGSDGFITEKTILFKGSRGSNFSRGGGSRVQVLISIETHITCDFRGGGGWRGVRTPYHPLWIRTWSHRRITLPHYMCKLPGRVKSGKFGHQVNSDTHLQIVLIQMRRLLMSRHIRSFTICIGNLFSFQYLKYETYKVAVRN